MRMILALALTVCFAAAVSAEDEATLLARLTDDDFDVREQATRDLGLSPEESAVRFMRMADEPGRDAEQAMRLRMAGLLVFKNKVLRHDAKWLNANSDMGCTIELRFTTVQKFMISDRFYTFVNITTLWGVEVQSRGWNASEDKLDVGDVIVAIDGKTFEQLSGENVLEKICGYDLVPFVMAGQEHELTVRRYIKDRTLNEYNVQTRIEPDDTDYVERKVKITVGWLDPDRLGPVQNFQRNKAYNEALKRFLESVKAPKK